MSYAGSILDKLIAHAVAISITNTTRGVNLIANLNDEDYPHCFAYEPKMSVSSLPFRQERILGDFTILLVTKGESQEQLLVRADAFRTRIQADRTLTGDVDTSYVSEIEVMEDPREGRKAAKIVVSTEEIE